jgi:hypothetical protein
MIGDRTQPPEFTTDFTDGTDGGRVLFASWRALREKGLGESSRETQSGSRRGAENAKAKADTLKSQKPKPISEFSPQSHEG